MPTQQGQYAATDETAIPFYDPADQINQYILEQQKKYANSFAAKAPRTAKGTVLREMSGSVYDGMSIDEPVNNVPFTTKYKIPLIAVGAVAMVGVAYVLMR